MGKSFYKASYSVTRKTYGDQGGADDQKAEMNTYQRLKPQVYGAESQ